MIDVNVWLALATERHEHHGAARNWFGSRGEQEAIFCRITQMGLLRLLTNKTVMGDEALKPRRAWAVYRKLRHDWRVDFAHEPQGLETKWIELMTRASAATSWTDAYLAAFALGHAHRLVSFDSGFKRWDELSLQLLTS